MHTIYKIPGIRHIIHSTELMADTLLILQHMAKICHPSDNWTQVHLIKLVLHWTNPIWVSIKAPLLTNHIHQTSRRLPSIHLHLHRTHLHQWQQICQLSPGLSTLRCRTPIMKIKSLNQLRPTKDLLLGKFENN